MFEKILLHDILEKDKDDFRKKIETAFEKRVKITMEQARSGKIPPIDAQNVLAAVYVPESSSHLYPWVLQSAYQHVGQKLDDAYNTATADAEHEYQHGAAVTDGKTVYYCVRFFDVLGVDGDSVGIGVQAFTMILGEVSVTEAKDIHSAPVDLSAGDLESLDNL